ncbi:TonB-dependent receptor [Parahaliea maris]|nr:TonB-dependent receptor [Parahaliea maris]
MIKFARFPQKHALVIAVSAAAATSAQMTSAQATLEEVIVTAERRAVSLQDTPISAVALTGLTLDERGVDTFEQLQYQVPSLTFTDNGNTKYLNIRGVGQSESAPNQTTGVAVHLDGGYVAREFVYGDAFFDVESVEVLRGPQGTYAGQNASGGAIFINSTRPVLGETTGFASVEAATYDKKRMGGGISFPLTETLAARVAVDWEQRDSFYKNHGPDLATSPSRVEDQPGNVDRSFGRFQLLYSPSDRFDARVIYELSDNKTDGVPYKFLREPGTNNLPDSNVRDLNVDLDGHRNVSYDRGTLQINWMVNDAFSFKGNLSYLESDQHYLSDDDRGSPLTDPDAVQAGNDFKILDEYWTAELSLVSETDGPLQWTVGASFLDYDQKNYLNFYRYNHPDYPGTGLDPTIHTRLYLDLNTIRENQAVFGEVGYSLTDSLTFKIGLRYNEDEVGFGDSSYISAGPFPEGRPSHYNAPSGRPFPADELLSFEKTTGRVLMEWTPGDNSLLYGTISTGYKPGGTTPFANEYESEEVTNYELGWKGSLFEDHINASVAAYYMEYDQFQRTYSPDPENPTASVTRNVDGSTIQGIEAQITGVFGDFLWDVSFAYNDGEYGELEIVLPPGAADGVNPVGFETINLEGEPIDYLPETSFNFGLSYQGFEFGSGRLIPTVRVSYQDEYYTTFYHYDYNLTPSKTLVDLFLAYEADAGWRVEGYAKNVTDKEYISRAQGGDDGWGEYLLGNPREVGVKLRYSF